MNKEIKLTNGLGNFLKKNCEKIPFKKKVFIVGRCHCECSLNVGHQNIINSNI